MKKKQALSSTSHTSVDVSEEMADNPACLKHHRLKKQGRETGHLSVRFSSISIREFPYTFGDNPGGLIGPPLTIEWNHQFEITVTVDEYEISRPRRRFGREMLLPSSERIDILKRAGFGRQDIVRLTKPVNVARAQRKRTANTLNFAGLHVVSEMLSRKTMDALTMGARKRKERELFKMSSSLSSTSASVTEEPSSTEKDDDVVCFEKLSLSGNNIVGEDSEELESVDV